MILSERLAHLGRLRRMLEEQLESVKAQEAELVRLEQRESMFLAKRLTHNGHMAASEAEVSTASKKGE